VGAGISVVGGLANASAKRKQQQAQKAAIASQAKMDTLNSELQLMSLTNQLAIDKRQSLLNQAVEDEAYLNRQFQLDATQLQNTTALEDARIQAQAMEKGAGLQQEATSIGALQQQTNQDSQISQTLASSIGASTQETEAALKGLAALPERQRQQTISRLMDLAATDDGQNLALEMLAELQEQGSVGTVARANEFGDVSIEQADAVANAGKDQSAATRALTDTGSVLQADSQRYQSATSLLDQSTARTTNAAASEAERIATEASYNASQANRSLESATRDAQYAAQQDLLKQGAALSASSSAAQAKAVGSTGFLDYLGVAAQGASTYNSLGGSFDFLKGRQVGGSKGVLTDVTNVNNNVG
jgi:hypothetical protein